MSTHLEVLRQRDEAQVRVAELEQTNTRLQKERGDFETMWKREHLQCEAALAALVDAAAANTRLREEVEQAKRDYALLNDKWQAQIEDLVAARRLNTPLLSALRDAIRKCPMCHGAGQWESTCYRCQDSTDDHECQTTSYQCETCAPWRAALPPESQPAPTSGVTGTTSDSRPICNLGHTFVPAPFYPERCDARVEDDGKRRQCGKPRSEHQP